MWLSSHNEAACFPASPAFSRAEVWVLQSQCFMEQFWTLQIIFQAEKKYSRHLCIYCMLSKSRAISALQWKIQQTLTNCLLSQFCIYTGQLGNNRDSNKHSLPRKVAIKQAIKGEWEANIGAPWGHMAGCWENLGVQREPCCAYES